MLGGLSHVEITVAVVFIAAVFFFINDDDIVYWFVQQTTKQGCRADRPNRFAEFGDNNFVIFSSNLIDKSSLAVSDTLLRWWELRNWVTEDIHTYT